MQKKNTFGKLAGTNGLSMEIETRGSTNPMQRGEARNALSELYNAKGLIINKQEDIESEAVNYFSGLYNQEDIGIKAFDIGIKKKLT